MHHFGVLVPATNTTVETEYGRLLPATLQVHVARIPLLSSGAETSPRGGDADVDYQARLLGDARVAVVALAQTAASLSSDGFDDKIIRRMSEAAGVPAITSARAIGLAVRALGASAHRSGGTISSRDAQTARTPLHRQIWAGGCSKRKLFRHRLGPIPDARTGTGARCNHPDQSPGN